MSSDGNMYRGVGLSVKDSSREFIFSFATVGVDDVAVCKEKVFTSWEEGCKLACGLVGVCYLCR